MAITHAGIAEWAMELEEDLIAFDGLDDAVIGIVQVHTQPSRVAYSYEKIVEILMDQDMTYEEAVEYFDFNIGCLWAGENTPAIVHSAGDAEHGIYS